MARVLLVGETWTVHSIHVKGFDTFTSSEYGDGSRHYRQTLESRGHTVTHMPGHLAPTDFPRAVADLEAWDVVVLSDIGANSLAITAEAWRGVPTPNPMDVLAAWVAEGGGLAMCGGYLSFAGIEAKAHFAGTGVERALPVTISRSDDRVENPTAGRPTVIKPDHEIVAGADDAWPGVLGYNRFEAKPDSIVLATIGTDPFVVVGGNGAGRSLAFATDIGPHWAPDAFVCSNAYQQFWPRAIDWLAGASTRGQ